MDIELIKEWLGVKGELEKLIDSPMRRTMEMLFEEWYEKAKPKEVLEKKKLLAIAMKQNAEADLDEIETKLVAISVKSKEEPIDEIKP